MKVISTVSALTVALVFSASSAFAAPKASALAAAKAPKADALKKQDPTSGTQKEAGSLKDSSAPGSSASAISQSATTVSAVAAPAPKKFGVNWIMVNGYDIQPLIDATPTDIAADQSLRFNYKATPTTSFRLALEASNKWGVDSSGKSTFTWLDPYLQVANSSLLVLPAGVKVSGFLRGYAAVTEATATNMYGVVRGGITLSKELGRLTMTYDNDSRAYVQRDLSRFDKKAKGMAVTPLAKTKNWLTGSVDLGGGLAVYQSLGSTLKYYNEDNGLTKNAQNFFFAETGIEYGISSNFLVILGINAEETRDLNAQEDSYWAERTAFYRGTESSAFLLTSVSF